MINHHGAIGVTGSGLGPLGTSPAKKGFLSSLSRNLEGCEDQDRLSLSILWGHLVVMPLLALLVFHQSFMQALVASVCLTGGATAAYTVYKGQRAFSVVVAVALMGYSGVIIYISGGMVSMHFHVFVAMAYLIVYYDWLPIVVAAVVISVHHVVFNAYDPQHLLSDGASWVQVFAHAAFVVAEAAANSLVALLLRNVIMTARAQTIALRRAEAELRDNVLSLETRARTLTDERTRTLVDTEARTREAAARLEQGVTQLIEELAPAAEGDLTVRPHLSADAGDIAVVADFTGVLIGSFADVARLVRDASSQVQVDSDRLTARIEGLTQAVAERTVQVNETAAVAGGIADSASEVLLSVEQVKGATHEAVASVEQGNQAVAQTLERMDAMRATMIGATRQIKRLSDSSLAMNSTVGLVLQFAGDLELLADNAQIEAARHSEAGGVFTAVAEQTGRLAEDAQKALNDIQTAVLTNRQETAEVGRQMEQMATEVVLGARAVEEARAAFGAITQTVRELDGFVARVNGVARAQVEVANTVGAAMAQIAGFFDQTATDVRLSETDASGLRRTIDDLRASIVTLKIEADDTATPRAA